MNRKSWINKDFTATAFSLIFFLLFQTFLVRADEITELSLEDCIEIGLKQNLEIKTEQIKTNMVKARLGEANSRQLPSVVISGAYSRFSEINPGIMDVTIPGPGGTPINTTVEFPEPLLNNTGFRVSLKQPLFTGFRIRKSIDLATLQYESSINNTIKSENDIRFSIEKAYWNYVLAKASLNVINETILTIQAHNKDVKNYFDKELVTYNEVLKADTQLAQAQLMQTEGQNFLEIARIQLNIILGFSWNELVQYLEADLEKPHPQLEEQSIYINRAFKKRPELKGAELGIRADNNAVKITQSGLYPNLFLTGNLTFANPNQRVFPQTDEFTLTWDVGILLTMDLGSIPKVINQIKQAKAKIELSENIRSQTEQGIIIEVVKAYQECEKAEKEISATKLLVSQCEENEKVVKEHVEKGLALSSEQTDAESILFKAKLDYTQALVHYMTAMALLSKATGY